MKGEVTKYFEEKGFGFIKGEDGQDYFIHVSSLKDKNEVAKLSLGSYVEFGTIASKKGPQAIEAKIIQKPTSYFGNRYSTPNTVLYSKNGSVPGYEVLQRCNWRITGNTNSAGESWDLAKQDLLEKAKRIGANALINVHYSKDTGQDGNYKYTTHHYTGDPVIIGKRNSQGYSPEELLQDMNSRAQSIYNDAIFARRNTGVFMMLLTLLLASIISVNVDQSSTTIVFLVVAAASGFLSLLITFSVGKDVINSFTKN